MLNFRYSQVKVRKREKNKKKMVCGGIMKERGRRDTARQR